MNNENFSNYLLRDIVIPDILDGDTPEIMYWAGKKLFSHFQEDITSEEKLIEFFNKSQMGDLTIKKAAKTKYDFVLSGSVVQQRLVQKKEFSLEAGFLFEYVQTVTNSYCLSNINTKSKEVIITIDIDHKSNIK